MSRPPATGRNSARRAHPRTRLLAVLATAAVAVWMMCPGADARAASTKAMWGPATVNGVSQFPTYRDLGVKIYEASIEWHDIASRRPRHATDPSDPAYRWPADLAPTVAQAHANGIAVALQIIGAPSWANGGHAWNWAPRNPKDFADFATAASRRFPSVHLWMIWGEPSRQPNFQPLQPAAPFAKLTATQAAAPHRYARILDAAYGALKQVSRRNLVIGGMTYTAGDIRTQQWIENLKLPNGRPPRLDLYGHNPFSFRDPNFANPPSAGGGVDFSDLRRLAGWIDRYLGRGRPQIKLFLSEWTIPTAVDTEFNYFVTPAVQAKWITDGLRLARNWSRVYAVGWIHLYDDLPQTGGGLLDAQGDKKPGYFAWKNG
jgi:hypothetical protein